MTHDELTAKAMKWLRKIEPKMPERIRKVTVDRMPKQRVRDAVVIDFSSDDNLGTIQVVIERDTEILSGRATLRPRRHQNKMLA